jgi:hypothetical protein
MAALDFPPSPVVGDKYPVTPVPGQPQYTWDGEKWTTTGAQVTSASPSNNLPLMDATPAVPGVGTQYSREDHVHPTDTSRAADTAVLKKVPQSLTVTEQTDVRKNLYAAPFDALAYNGMQVNGSMEVSQENGASSVSLPANSTKHVIDSWVASITGTGAGAAIQSAFGPPGFANALALQCSTVSSLAGATDVQQVYTSIEGYRWSRLGFGAANAQSVTIGFWINPHIAGTMAVAVMNGAQNRSYVVDVPVVAGWQYKTVTIPGETSGTWAVGNTTGAWIMFCFGGGSSRKNVANTWHAGNFSASLTTTNFFSATGYINLTGVVVLPGIEAPSAARSPLIMRPFDQELEICQRYFLNIPTNGRYFACNGLTDHATFSLDYPVEMRATPTVGALPWVDGNYNTAVGAGQWCLSRIGVVGATKTGTIISTVHTFPASAIAIFRSAVWSSVTTSLNCGPSGMAPLTFDARL